MTGRRLVRTLCFSFCLFLSGRRGEAHTVNYDVLPKGISVRVSYAANEPASYSQYEIFAPGDEQPYATGRTDRNGCVCFLPNKAGVWKVKVLGESTHGFHGATIDVKVDQALGVESFSKPLVAQYTKAITGLSIVFGLFGIYALLRSRRKSA